MGPIAYILSFCSAAPKHSQLQAFNLIEDSLASCRTRSDAEEAGRAVGGSTRGSPGEDLDNLELPILLPLASILSSVTRFPTPVRLSFCIQAGSGEETGR